ncbi:MAG: hypothetical protein ABJ263_04755 [Tateyamaria sp.]|uniref:hypothetical protein n=1 Tax=Tateyamaria sp. TaxID=1929288 RepID=UPI003279E01E
MKPMLTLIAAVATTPVLAHPSQSPHAHHEATTFSPMAAVVALALVGAAVIAAPHLRNVMASVTAR